jgi:two-component system, OmpR family, sensor histidine kinase VanS
VTAAAPPRPVRRHGPGLRVRLALSYAGVALAAGLVLAAVLLVVLRYVPDENLAVLDGGGFAPSRGDLVTAALPLVGAGLAGLVLLGLGCGWVVAGRVLRPLEAVADGSLSHRVRLPGPDDELRRLADDVDQMLERLETAFEEQRRFTANASHELRTPTAAVRAVVEVARADPAGRDVDEVLARVAELTDRSAATLEALLQLARAERGVVGREPCDLVEVLEEALDEAGGDVEVHVDVPSDPVVVRGDRALLDRLAGNLVRNARVHNVPVGGTVWAAVEAGPAGAVLRVASTGAPLDPAAVDGLVQPFVRGAGRVAGDGGSGLGLAVVASVARAHGARLDLAARPGGGLDARVTFPATG